MPLRAMLFLLLTGCSHPGASPAGSTAGEQLVGMWRLVEVVAVREDGSTTPSRWGPHPSGYIVYDRSGRMAAQIMAGPPPSFRDGAHPTDEELIAACDSYLAYAGSYAYDAATRVVTHHVEMTIDPRDLGRDLTREVRLDGDRVVLLTPAYQSKSGEQVRNRLTWERVRAPP